MVVKVNIKDVAAKANVSIATVSRFLNGKTERMSKETALRVQNAIQELGYVPNDAARQMITRKSKLIAVIVADIDDYFATEMFKGISSILDAKGYTAVLFDSDSNKERELELIKIVGEKLFDALIIQPITNKESEIKTALKREIPIVAVDRELSDATVSTVRTNNFDISKKVTNYYMRQGYEKVVIVTGEIVGISTREERYAGIKSVCDNSMLVEVSEKDLKLNDTYDTLKNILISSNERTVIFSLKERWLLHLIPRLMADGFMNSYGVAITGFSDTDVIKAINPLVSLINQNPYLQGASAAELLFDELSTGKTDRPQKIIISGKFK
ncbi:LacI family DNA-binding transcriptional regulator [Latilactobacillus sakei]|uniref:LacI family DNA-binding transcriptional regulator n=1 Tax=Latilactobacillus sakei TaxID=1599 RepID=UPI00388532DA